MNSGLISDFGNNLCRSLCPHVWASIIDCTGPLLHSWQKSIFLLLCCVDLEWLWGGWIYTSNYHDSYHKMVSATVQPLLFEPMLLKSQHDSFHCSKSQPFGYLSRLKRVLGIWWQLFDTGLLLLYHREVSLSLDNGKLWWFSQLWTHAELAKGFGLCRMCVSLRLWMAWNVWTAFSSVNNAIV